MDDRARGIDHLVLYGRAPEWTMLRISMASEVAFLDGRPYVGLDNIDMRDRFVPR